MENNKGFTLIELLSVIVILALLALLTTTSITKLVKDSKEDLYNSQLMAIKSASESWSSSNLQYLPNKGECIYITVGVLKNSGLIDQNLVDARTNSQISNDINIKITSLNNKGNATTSFSYEVNPESVDGCKLYNSEISVVDNVFTTKLNEDGTLTITGFKENYKDIKSMIIPSTIGDKKVTIIDTYAFASNYSLEKVVISEGITEIKSSFLGCTNLISVSLPSTLKVLGSFKNCTNLKSIVIPEGVTSIASQAFYNCNNLKSVILPKSVNTIDYSAFQCRNLQTITYNGTINEWNNIIKKSYTVQTGLIYDWNSYSAINKIVCSNGEVSITPYYTTITN